MQVKAAATLYIYSCYFHYFSSVTTTSYIHSLLLLLLRCTWFLSLALHLAQYNATDTMKSTPTGSKRKKMHNRSRQRAKNRCHPIKEGVLKKFKENQGVDNKDSTSHFIQYAESIKGEDSETSKNGTEVRHD